MGRFIQMTTRLKTHERHLQGLSFVVCFFLGGSSVLYRRPFGHRGSVVDPDQLDNVIEFGRSRKSRQPQFSFNAFYLSGSGRLRNTIAGVQGVRTIEVQSVEALSSALMLYQPDCIFIESDLSWSDPYSLVSHLTTHFVAPVIMHYEQEESAKNSQDVKRAYAAGVSDTFFGKVCEFELQRALRVLLRMKQELVEWIC